MRDKQIEENRRKISDRQIEEMAIVIYHGRKMGDAPMSIASDLYNAGYRKASDVAREIFEEIRAESSYCVASQNGVEIYHTKLHNISAIKLDELKKKYTEET